MSSTGAALGATQAMTRAEMEHAFCERLTDDCLRIAVGSRFDALMLWQQRDGYIMRLAQHKTTLWDD